MQSWSPVKIVSLSVGAPFRSTFASHENGFLQVVPCRYSFCIHDAPILGVCGTPGPCISYPQLHDHRRCAMAPAGPLLRRRILFNTWALASVDASSRHWDRDTDDAFLVWKVNMHEPTLVAGWRAALLAFLKDSPLKDSPTYSEMPLQGRDLVPPVCFVGKF